jgi:hypothetical protein
LNPKTIAFLLLIFIGEITITSYHVNPSNSDIVLINSEIFDGNISYIQNKLTNNVPVIFYGNDSIQISQFYQTRLNREGIEMNESRLVVHSLWVQKLENKIVEHQLRVNDISFLQQKLESIYNWLDETTFQQYPSTYEIVGTMTEINHHEPYGLLKTRTEILKVEEVNYDHDWYDITVEQSLIPGVNYTGASWEWKWLTYTMNGSLGTSNVVLTDYDPPPKKDPIKGPFTFLWRLLGFDIRNLIPWLSSPKQEIKNLDMSDFSVELFRVRYEAPNEYEFKHKAFLKRHHYVLRTKEGEMPRFWQQTQIKYIQGVDFARIPYITEPLASGYFSVKK